MEILLEGLKKLTFKGYDSCGLGIDSKDGGGFELLRVPGTIQGLHDVIKAESGRLEMGDILNNHVGIGHTRWATHGPPSVVNTHPIPSNPESDFIVVHNGMLTNCNELKAELNTRFYSDTDTEVIGQLALKIYSDHGGKHHISFREIVEQICLKLHGAYALVIKSKHYPNETVAVTRSSPLVIGIKTKRKLHTNHIPIYYSEGSIIIILQISMCAHNNNHGLTLIPAA